MGGEVRSARLANVEDAEKLEALQQRGKLVLQQHREAYRPPMYVPEPAPATDARIADQPVTQMPPNIVLQSVQREAN